MDYKYLQNKLDEAKEYTKSPSIDEQYQELCSKYSDAYLQGSSWYVGKTLKDININSPDILMSMFMILSYK